MIELICIDAGMGYFTRGKSYIVKAADDTTCCIEGNDKVDRWVERTDPAFIFKHIPEAVNGQVAFIDMYLSLLMSLDICGGDPESILKDARDMTLMDILIGLSSNRVRFHVIPK